MNATIFPLVLGDEVHLLTAIVIGFVFGLGLEGAGFGSARKLAAQFYFYDMAVFKVMFTAIIVAMVGLYSLAGVGLVDMSAIWINPTYMWAQVIGGFFMGMGFIVAGLCPGTSAVSLASGRWDGLMVMGGIVVGSLVFAITVAMFPGLEWLFNNGRVISLLPQVLNLPVLVVVVGVVVMALAGFVGAEAVERKLSGKFEPVPLTPEPTSRTPRVKFALAGSLVAIVLVSLAWTASEPIHSPTAASAIQPLELAEAIIGSNKDLLILDLRADLGEGGIPGAYAVNDSTALPVLAGAGTGTLVVVYDETGSTQEVAGIWPAALTYRYVQGGLVAWEAEVLTPMMPASYAMADQEAVERQRQIAAFFSGAAVTATVKAPPPMLPSGGSRKKKEKVGGC